MDIIHNHYVCRILLTFLPIEIVHIIAFKFGILQHYFIKKSFYELRKHNIVNYRMRNDITNLAFRFPDIMPPYISKEAKICQVRDIKVRYSNLTQNYCLQYSNNNAGRYTFTELLKMICLFFGDKKEYNNMLYEIFNNKSLTSMIRFYYKLEPFDFNTNNFSEKILDKYDMFEKKLFTSK